MNEGKALHSNISKQTRRRWRFTQHESVARREGRSTRVALAWPSIEAQIGTAACRGKAAKASGRGTAAQTQRARKIQKKRRMVASKCHKAGQEAGEGGNPVGQIGMMKFSCWGKRYREQLE